MRRDGLPDVVVFGTPIEEEISISGRTVRNLGGCAIYAAMASAKTSARTALIGRWPEGFRERERAELSEFVELGACDRVPGNPGREHIRYDADLEVVERTAAEGLETSVGIRDLPPEWRHARAALVPPLGPVAGQRELLRRLRDGTGIPLLAVSLSANGIQEARSDFLDLLRTSDVAFMNLSEAYSAADGEDLFAFIDRNTRCAVIALGDGGALLLSAGRVRHCVGPRAVIVDPTGSLAALAGAVVGAIATGCPIENAVVMGNVAAGHAASEIGLEGILRSPLVRERKERPRKNSPRFLVDAGRIRAIAKSLSARRRDQNLPNNGSSLQNSLLQDGGEFRGGEQGAPPLGVRDGSAVADVNGYQPFSFTEPSRFYPPVGHPRALEYFCAVVKHQFGFWKLASERWAGSMYASVDGEKLKGSDFVWRSATKALMSGAGDLTSFLDDTGRCPLPMADEHRALAAAYDEYVKACPPISWVVEANSSPNSVETLLTRLSQVPGYREDPMRKKAMLLAMTLCQRPEKFLFAEPAGNRSFGPVVDYHVQRTALRAGIVVPFDDAIRAKLVARQLLTAEEEAEARTAVWRAMNALSERSGISHPALDLLFFKARSVCPEASEPQCEKCPLDAGCAHQKALFQPVFRTTAY